MRKLLLSAVASLIATQAAAVQCTDTSHVEAQLMAKHGETMSHFGVLPNRNLLQVFLNESSESWSIIVEVPSRGLSCLLSTGYGFETVMSNRYVDRVNLLPMS